MRQSLKTRSTLAETAPSASETLCLSCVAADVEAAAATAATAAAVAAMHDRTSERAWLQYLLLPPPFLSI
jgi:seryl-tRNA(Sec) selenium transferase